MDNPFERDDLGYRVLVNDEGQHSLWPEFIDVPPGWQPAFGPATRAECVEYVDREWTDLRPASLIAEMAEHHG
ncbi:MAG TPA: MbtH family protein [Pseudonocardiaceae bacterium]|nr:MbtH family protein [Pseudonocardiaceae bacterium]